MASNLSAAALSAFGLLRVSAAVLPTMLCADHSGGCRAAGLLVGITMYPSVLSLLRHITEMRLLTVKLQYAAAAFS